MTTIASAFQSLLDQLVADDLEKGLQVAVYHRGKWVVDASAGTMGRPENGPVDSRTLFPVFSTTKGIAATVLHLLVERGKITYETPIAEVWPEFAAQGKERITLQHALNHTSGIPFMPKGLTEAELFDWDTMCAAIADLKPVSAPGMERSYHAITYGWILGEVASRIDGRPFWKILEEEIYAPLNLRDEMFVGIPNQVESRVAYLEAKPRPGEVPPDETTPQAIPALVQPLHDWMNRPAPRRACLPASNGIMTARAVAKHYAALLPGGVDGVELLSPERVRLATAPQWPGNAQPGDPPMEQRLGYVIIPAFSPEAFGHGGYGGSLGFADPVSGVAFGFTRNRFDSDDTWGLLIETLKKALAES